MPFVPRTVDEVYEEWISRWLTRSPATDVTEGSVVSIIGRTHAEMLAASEREIWRVREAFDFRNARGIDLDQRLEDFPGFEGRIGATVAVGGAARLTRRDDGVLAEWVLTAGATFSRAADGIVYETIVDVTFPAGATVLDGVALRCRTPGASGNCRAGEVNKVVQAFNNDGRIIAINNTLPISNALDSETDEQLIERALLWLSGLTSNTVQALRYLGATFVAADGTRARQAQIYEDPDAPYVELLIDDGAALLGFSRPGVAVEGIIPEGSPGGWYIYHETPATTPISFVFINGEQLDPVHYKSYPEQGRVRILETAPVAAGDSWLISKYPVWTNLPKELQLLINNTRKPSGVRVRVVAPMIHWVNLDMNVLPVEGADFDEVIRGVKAISVDYMASLVPGEPLYISRLVAAIHEYDLVKTVRVLSPGTGVLSRDISPTSLRHVIRTQEERISVVPLNV